VCVCACVRVCFCVCVFFCVCCTHTHPHTRTHTHTIRSNYTVGKEDSNIARPKKKGKQVLTSLNLIQGTRLTSVSRTHTTRVLCLTKTKQVRNCTHTHTHTHTHTPHTHTHTHTLTHQRLYLNRFPGSPQQLKSIGVSLRSTEEEKTSEVD
jgi:hypothetical protein